jgi:hypothetical protein
MAASSEQAKDLVDHLPLQDRGHEAEADPLHAMPSGRSAGEDRR